MGNINHIIEPNRLKLIWQSSNPKFRTRFVVADLIRSSYCVSLFYKKFTHDFQNAQLFGFQGHPAFRIDQAVHHQNVLEVFSRRLPSRNRTDFPTYLAKHRLDNHLNISDFALLGYTGGALPSDGFSCAIDFEYEDKPHQFMMEVAGFRYHAGMNVEIPSLTNQIAVFAPEDNNDHDPFAVQIIVSGVKIGYVPRYYAQLFRIWMNDSFLYGSIERIDGTLTKPQVHLMVYVIPNGKNYQSFNQIGSVTGSL